jgi:type I restriction enzyme R subunit
LEETFKGDISLNPTVEEEIIKYNTTIVTEKPEDTDALLDEILNKINERVKGIFTEADKVIVRTLYNKSVKENEKLERYAKKNDSEVFQQSIYPEVFKKVAQECYVEQVDSFTKLFEDKAFYQSVQEEIAKEVYKYLRSKEVS